MKAYKVNLVQRNKKGVVTFHALAESIHAEDEKALSLVLATYFKDTMDSPDELKEFRYISGSMRIKLTHDMAFEIDSLNEACNVKFTIPSFGRLIKDHTLKDLQEIIYISYRFYCEFGGIWSFK